MTGVEKQRVRQMRRQGMGYAQIAVSLGLSKNTVKSFCRRNQPGECSAAADILNEAENAAVCKQCGKHMRQEQKRKTKKFCCDQCRLAWWNENRDRVNRKAFYCLTCAFCGRAFESYGNRNRKYCSHVCYVRDRFNRSASS